MTQIAVQQCTAAVQSRLSNRVGVAGHPRRHPRRPGGHRPRAERHPGRPAQQQHVRVRGFANSGYSPYGVGAYGAAGYGYQPDLSFKCDVDYRGRVRDIDINRRR